MVRNSRIFTFTCPHLPYEHPDFLDFLRWNKTVFKPDRVVCIGDEADKHAMSYHEHDPDLESSGTELMLTRTKFRKIYKIFPKVDVVDSNHGSMHLRKAKTAGIPRAYVRDIKEILEAPDGWNWHNHLIIKMSNGQKLYCAHQIEKNVLMAAQKKGMCCVQGHYHTQFDIRYSANTEMLIWGMTLGCLINDKSFAFAYNKVHKDKPIIGAGRIDNGVPQLVPMQLNKKGRWDI